MYKIPTMLVLRRPENQTPWAVAKGRKVWQQNARADANNIRAAALATPMRVSG